MENNYERDIRFSEMIEDLDEQDEKDALLKVGKYLYTEYRYVFSELEKDLAMDFEGFIADALMKEDSFEPFVDDVMVDINSNKRRHASLIATMQVEEIEE